VAVTTKAESCLETEGKEIRTDRSRCDGKVHIPAKLEANCVEGFVEDHIEFDKDANH
jgi:hypothetical protein